MKFPKYFTNVIENYPEAEWDSKLNNIYKKLNQFQIIEFVVLILNIALLIWSEMNNIIPLCIFFCITHFYLFITWCQRWIDIVHHPIYFGNQKEVTFRKFYWDPFMKTCKFFGNKLKKFGV